MPVQVNNELRATELSEQISEIIVERKKITLQELLQEGNWKYSYQIRLVNII